MRALSGVELAGLVNMATDPGYIVVDGDPLEHGLNACAERGLATYRNNGLDEYWDINDLGRLALRVHYAVTQDAG